MEEINLYKLLRFYVQNWLLIVTITLIGFAAGLAYNQFIQVPMYKSNATLLFVNPNGRGSTQDATWLNNYVQLFQSRRVLEPVIKDQNLDVSFDSFIGAVSAVNDKGTEVIRLSVSTDDPVRSQEFLRQAVVSFKAEAKELYGNDNLRIVDNASNAEPPYNVKKELQLAIATGAGFVVSLLVLFFIYDARGGKVDDWGRKKRQAAKAKPAPRTKTSKPTAVPAVSTNAQAATGIAGLWAKVKTSVINSLWIEESDATVPKRDDNKN